MTGCLIISRLYRAAILPCNAGYKNTAPLANTTKQREYTMYTEVLLGFGSNLGDRCRILSDAWEQLGQMPGVELVRISQMYPTCPVGGPPNQGEFLNAVGIVRTLTGPLELLRQIQELESRFGRVRVEHWGPRTLDIDLLLFGDQIIEIPTLTVPHPKMLRRMFVLEPAMEIAPNWIHPHSGCTLAEHWKQAR